MATVVCPHCHQEVPAVEWPILAGLGAGDDTAQVYVPARATRCPACGGVLD